MRNSAIMLWVLMGLIGLFIYTTIGLIIWIPICISNIILQIRSGEIRENGINEQFSIYKWNDIVCFDLNKNEIIIVTNKKSILTRKNKGFITGKN
ncbi:MAG: hypothetical protein FH761_11300 [Firmicutes bacterium]|nr:hypothetical protein [Bacillota bacterium]